jgi:hypothetical protein
MAAIQIGMRRNSGEDFTKGMAAVGQAAGVINKIKSDQAQEGRLDDQNQRAEDANVRSQETHDQTIGEAEKKIAIQDFKNEFTLENQQVTEAGGIMKPSFKDFTPAKARAYSEWQVEHALQNKELQATMAELHAGQAKEQYAKINNEWASAQSAVSGGVPDYDTAFVHVEKAYEFHNDGADIVFNKDKTGYEVTMADGQKRSVQFGSKEAMFKDFNDKFGELQGPEGAKNYAKLYGKDMKDRQKRNAAKALDMKYFTNDKGYEAQAGTFEDETGRSSNKIRVWGPDGTDLGFFTQAEFDKHNFKDVTQRKGEAAIGASDAKAAASKATAKKDSRTGMSPELKLTKDIAKTFKVSDQVAMDRVLNNKEMAAKINVVLALIEKRGIDHEKTQAAIKGLGLDKMFGGTGLSPGQGLQKEQKTRDQAATASKSEGVKTGKGVSKMTKADYTQDELTSMAADSQRLKNEGKTDAQIAQTLRNKYSK